MARGSIYPYRLADGSTRFEVLYRTSNGVQRKKRGFSGPREAERYLNQVIAAVDRGEVIASKVTFADYIDRWLVEHRPRIEESTYRDYRANIERRLKPFFGELRLTEIEPSDVRRYVSALVEGTGAGAERQGERIGAARTWAERLGELTVRDLAERLDVGPKAARRLIERMEQEATIARAGDRAPRTAGRRENVWRFTGPAGRAEARPRAPISAKTINNSITVLRVALGHAEEDGLIARNPAASKPGARERIKLPRDHQEMDYLRLREIPRYLDACMPAYRPLAEVLIGCGLRISEALDLTWASVDFETQTLRILGSRKLRHEGGETSGSTKGDRFRSVDFGPRLERILRDLRARATEHRSGDPSVGCVFVGAGGAELDRRDVSRGEHKAALRRAPLRDTLRLHDLRHTAAASWLAAGLPLIYVQRQLGHASIKTTEEQYGHLERSFLQGAARRAEAAIWERSGLLPAAALR